MLILSPSAPKKEKDARIKEELHKFKRGELRSGSKQGPVVTSRRQALAIALSESGQSRDQKRKAKRSTSRRTSRR